MKRKPMQNNQSKVVRTKKVPVRTGEQKPELGRIVREMHRFMRKEKIPAISLSR